MRRPPWSEFRAALAAVGFRPSRRLGQNFLLDDNAARAIARDAGVEPGDFVLEIGPGCGFLSVHLAARGGRLLAVEIDPRLAAVAREFLAPFPDARVQVGDVLAGKRELSPAVRAELPAEGDWLLASNLPYAASAPCLAVVSRLPNPPAAMTVLVQAEVGERLAARPGTAAWGALSARLQWLYDVRVLRSVSPRLFWPRPKVESSVVRLVRRRPAPPPDATERLDRLLDGLFRTRRKTLRNALRGEAGDPAAADAWLARAGLDGGRRADTLDLGELVRLAAER